MAVIQVKKYKIIKDDNGNKVQVSKTKDEWNKETRNGTMTWYFSDRYEIDNKTKQYRSKLFPTKREAESDERLFLINPLEYIRTQSKKAKNNQKSNLELQSSSEKKLNDYFDDFIQYKLQFIKGHSIYEYRKDWLNHISGFMGNLTTKDITLKLIQNWHEQANNILNPRTQLPYATKTKNKWYTSLSEFLQYLHTLGLVDVNYAKNIGQFKNNNINKNTKKKIRYQTLEQFEIFMNEVDDDLWYAFFYFLFWHGIRIGEQRALRIEDVDMKNNMIHFHKTFTKDHNGKEVLGPIKNRKERFTPLSEKTKPILENLINQYKLIPGYSDNWFLFGGAFRIPAKTIENRLSKYYDIVIAKNPNKKITKLTHHEFGRHSHASYLLNKGIESGMSTDEMYSIIAQRLGDTVDVIKDTYAHPYEDKNNEKMRNLLNL